MKLYVLLAMLIEASNNDPEPDVAIRQIWILISEMRKASVSAIHDTSCITLTITLHKGEVHVRQEIQHG